MIQTFRGYSLLISGLKATEKGACNVTLNNNNNNKTKNAKFTAYPVPRWSQCGLKFHMKSAHPVNVAISVFFCFSVTLNAHFSVAFKPLMKREYLRNVWLTFKILVRRFELSFTIHPHYCASQFLRIIFLSTLLPGHLPLDFLAGG